jgi:hypothetical protein
MQRIGATGILKGTGITYKWANQTWFYPNRIVSEHEWKTGLLPYFPQLEKMAASGAGLTLTYLASVLETIQPKTDTSITQQDWTDLGINQPFSETTELNRHTISILTDTLLNPFDVEIDWNGRIK